MPVTIPVEEPIVATGGVPLLHVPPDELSPNVAIAPAQTVGSPVIPDGNGFTVTVVVT
jgi:hypothetical protein